MATGRFLGGLAAGLGLAAAAGLAVMLAGSPPGRVAPERADAADETGAPAFTDAGAPRETGSGPAGDAEERAGATGRASAPAEGADRASDAREADRASAAREADRASAAREAEAAVEAAAEALADAADEAAKGPAFDVVRVERDGSALVAGRAAPGARVEIEVDGTPRGEAEADADGGFVAFLRLPGGDGARRLDLVETGRGGRSRRGREPVIVAAPDGDEPDAQPLVVAAREQGLEVLQGEAGGAEERVSIEMGRQDRAGGAVDLAGRAEGLQRIKVFADARLVAETVAGADGRWTATVEAADAAAAERFAVEALDQAGAVVARASAPAVVVDEAQERRIGAGEILVRQGDTLWRIAENLFGDGLRYTVIYRANADRIRDPDLIFPGQALTVPGAAGGE